MPVATDAWFTCGKASPVKDRLRDMRVCGVTYAAFSAGEYGWSKESAEAAENALSEDTDSLRYL